jgi:hypothetical protein
MHDAALKFQGAVEIGASNPRPNLVEFRKS